MEKRLCATCGAPCPPSLGDKPRTYCSNSCKQRAYLARRHTRACAWCGQTFAGLGDCCSVACRRSARSADREPLCELPWTQCRLCLAWYLNRRNSVFCCATCAFKAKRVNSLHFLCQECGSEVHATHHADKRRSFCSRRCSRQWHRALRRALERGGRTGARVYRMQIYERDGWRCGLCGWPVLKAATVPHPLSPTLDHVLPLASGGLHDPDNVQCAHFSCNSRVGAKKISSRMAEQA